MLQPGRMSQTFCGVKEGRHKSLLVTPFVEHSRTGKTNLSWENLAQRLPLAAQRGTTGKGDRGGRFLEWRKGSKSWSRGWLHGSTHMGEFVMLWVHSLHICYTAIKKAFLKKKKVVQTKSSISVIPSMVSLYPFCTPFWHTARLSPYPPFPQHELANAE